MPHWKANDVVDLPGLAPEYSKVGYSLMWPKPAPRLAQGETAVVGNRFARTAGVTNNSFKD